MVWQIGNYKMQKGECMVPCPTCYFDTVALGNIQLVFSPSSPLSHGVLILVLNGWMEHTYMEDSFSDLDASGYLMPIPLLGI